MWNSRGIQRLFGRGEDDITEKFELENDASPWVSQLHPDDRARVLQSIQDHLESDTPYDVDYRYRMPDGEYIWVHSIGRVIRSANGRPLRMVRLDSEITTHKQAEAVLRERDARHATVADLSQDLIWIFTDGFIVECDDYAAHALGLKFQEELVGRSVLSLLHPGDHEIAKIRFAQLLEGRSRHAEPENTPPSA
ncbi:MAG: PAS domain-containing protein [Alphaproteobacteria bacterium]